MATAAEWLEGARPRTWPTGVAPVLAGSGLAWFAGSFQLGRALLALVVACALQIGVNYANDYSDGIRGTDANRVGPMRLTASGAAAPSHVKRAAFLCFGVAAVAGLALVAWSGLWLFLLVGAACIVAAWYYTGGKHPYGYAGLGELFVFVFFGLVAVLGTVAVQALPIPPGAWFAAVAIGLLACAVLVANNLRDIPGDVTAGKHTLATRLGDRRTRLFYGLIVALTAVCILLLAATTTWWTLLALAFLAFEVRPARALLSGARGRALIPVLQFSGIAELVCALGMALGLVVGTR